MKISTLTGVTKSEEINVSKAIGSLIIATSLALDNLTTEKISAYIERGNGNNVILANKVNLKDFILASTYGTEAIQSFAPDFETVALCELSIDGSIFLDDKENIKFKFEDLVPGETYEFHGVEEPVQTNNVFVFEQKSVAIEETNKRINVTGFDLAVMTLDETIDDISYTFSNGQVVKYLPFELQVLSRDIDPVAYINADNGVIQSLDNKITLPLVEVDFIEINKSQGAIINFVVRTSKTV